MNHPPPKKNTLSNLHLPTLLWKTPTLKTWGLCLPGSWIPPAGLGLLKLGLEVANFLGEKVGGAPLRVSWSLLRLFFFPQQKELLNLLAVGDITYAYFFFLRIFLLWNMWDVKFQDGPKKMLWFPLLDTASLIDFFLKKIGRFHVDVWILVDEIISILPDFGIVKWPYGRESWHNEPTRISWGPEDNLSEISYIS